MATLAGGARHPPPPSRRTTGYHADHHTPPCCAPLTAWCNDIIARLPSTPAARISGVHAVLTASGGLPLPLRPFARYAFGPTHADTPLPGTAACPRCVALAAKCRVRLARRPLIVSRDEGQLSHPGAVENFPGCTWDASGSDIMKSLKEQVIFVSRHSSDRGQLSPAATCARTRAAPDTACFMFPGLGSHGSHGSHGSFHASQATRFGTRFLGGDVDACPLPPAPHLQTLSGHI